MKEKSSLAAAGTNVEETEEDIAAGCAGKTLNETIRNAVLKIIKSKKYRIKV